MRLLTAFASGLLFSLGLAISQMTYPDKIIAFLDVTGQWDPSLGLVMVGAIVVHLALYRLILRRPSPVYAGAFQVPTRTDITPSLVAGAGVFGVGWGLSGLCPGPSIVASVSGLTPILVFVASMAVGMLLYRGVDGILSRPDDPSTRQGTGDPGLIEA